MDPSKSVSKKKYPNDSTDSLNPKKVCLSNPSLESEEKELILNSRVVPSVICQNDLKSTNQRTVWLKTVTMMNYMTPTAS